MKNTKKNVIELLKKDLENTRAVARIFKEKGDEVAYKQYLAESSAIQNAIWLLEDNEYFNSQYKVYNTDAE